MDRPAPEPLMLQVWDGGARHAARREAVRWVGALGFPEAAVHEVELVVSELAGNLVKHAGGGTLRLEPLEVDGRRGFQLEAIDSGPGIEDGERAFEDGFSTAGSLGYGLGTVHRLMDEVELSSGPQGGTRVRCRRWLRPGSPEAGECPLDFGVVSRRHPAAQQNGDAFVVKSWGSNALVGVIDGLGHGHLASRAAQAARHYIERHYDHPLAAMFRETHRACRGTRGVVMALARFDCAAATFSYGSIGNIEARLLTSGERPSLIVRRGVVGLNNAPPARITTSPWEADSLMVLHSDGLSRRWTWDDFPGLGRASASDAARRLFGRLAKPDDDATVAVAKGTGVRPAAVRRFATTGGGA